MRADRLIQIVLLLQKRRAMSARELAEELGVSRRSIYRDIDALALIGIPVYAEQGSEGGYRLVENYRTSLSGLTHEELGALLALNFPEPLADLELGQKIKTALLKLYANIPPRQQKIYLDWTSGGFRHEAVPHIQQLYRAVQEDHCIIIHYRLLGSVDIEREVEPYGLVAQSGIWYLIYAGGGCIRHRRASTLLDVLVLEKPFVRPLSFDLEGYWKILSAELSGNTARFKTVLRMSPSVFRWLPHLLEQNVPPLTKVASSDDWIQLELCFDSFEVARKQILALGGGVEVLEPVALRLSVQDFAAQILQVYT